MEIHWRISHTKGFGTEVSEFGTMQMSSWFFIQENFLHKNL